MKVRWNHRARKKDDISLKTNVIESTTPPDFDETLTVSVDMAQVCMGNIKPCAMAKECSC